MPMNDLEKAGFCDLFINDSHNAQIAKQLAKSITGNILDIDSAQEALDCIFTHISDAYSLLLKKHITKEMIFKYLHQKGVPITKNFTKQTLIDKIIIYWNQSSLNYDEQATDGNTLRNQVVVQNSNSPTFLKSENEYPINLLARQFTEWFFKKYNEDNINVADYWIDARLSLSIIGNNEESTHECATSNEIIEILLQTRKQFGFIFNPNLYHSGVQGRMDSHGLVLVLACGTLHEQQNCVGVFECIFGLLRDPFTDNTWKVKRMQCILRSQLTNSLPSLDDCHTLRNALELPVSKEELT